MHKLWKYFVVLVMIKIAFMTFIYITTLQSKNSIQLQIPQDKYVRFSQPEEKGEINSRIEESKKNKRMYPRQELSNNRLNSLKKKKKLRSQQGNNKFNKKATHIFSKMESTNYKSDHTTIERNNSLENKKKSCTFLFDKDSLIKAKQILNLPREQPIFLFYIHIDISPSKGLDSFSKEHKDALLNWQYVIKDEKYLVQLPVDFDLITFDLLLRDHEETFFELKTFYNATNCTEEATEAIESIRFQLWNELFKNNTNYYLCNRNFTSEIGRNIMYYLTTIWIGYDLSCSGAPTEIGIKTFDAEKDQLPLVAPIFCFLMSLQFVWVFVVLDIINSKIKSSNILNQMESLQFHYQKEDRPYSVKRMILKLFICECSECCSSCNVNEDDECNTCHDICCRKDSEDRKCIRCFKSVLFFLRCFCCCSAKRRLTLLLWIFILVPFGSYRTLRRYTLNKEVYKEYLNVMRASEPLFDYITNDNNVAVTFDVFYACLFPVVFICLGGWIYDAYMAKEVERFTFFNYSKEPKHKNENRYFLFSNRLVSRCDNLHDNCRTYFNTCSKSCDDCCEQCCCNCSCENDCNCQCNCKFLLPCDFLFQLFLCFFPFFSFTTHVFRKKNSDCIKCCTNHCENKDNGCKCDKCCCTCTCICFIISTLFYCILWLLFYALCLRPIVSTFTFLLRFITYFVFVALPIRIHIFRYTLIFVTAIIYFAKYFNEIVSMNAEILRYIFFIEEKNKSGKRHLNYPESTTIHSKSSEFGWEENRKRTTESSYSSKSEVSLYVQECQEVVNENEESEDVNENNEDVHECQTFDVYESQKPESIAEDMFDKIYRNLLFVKRRLYFFGMKSVIVFMYLFITIETFINNRKYLSSTSFKDILEVALVLVGPYAISLFLKADEKNFLTNENKKEIKRAYEKYKEYLSSVRKENRKESESQNTETTSLSPSVTGAENDSDKDNLHLVTVKQKRISDKNVIKKTIQTQADIHETEFEMVLMGQSIREKEPSESDPLLPKIKNSNV